MRDARDLLPIVVALAIKPENAHTSRQAHLGGGEEEVRRASVVQLLMQVVHGTDHGLYSLGQLQRIERSLSGNPL